MPTTRGGGPEVTRPILDDPPAVRDDRSTEAVATSVVESAESPAVAALEDAATAVEDLVLKGYLDRLGELDPIAAPTDGSGRVGSSLSSVRFLRVSELVHARDEDSLLKFGSVLSALHSHGSAVVFLAQSDGNSTEYYLGARNDEGRVASARETLERAFCGQFPGSRITRLLDPQAEALIANIPRGNAAAISGIPAFKSDAVRGNQEFIQGLDKVAEAMRGESYTAVILATPVSTKRLREIRSGYEDIFSDLSPFATAQIADSVNESEQASIAKGSAVARGSNENVTDTEQTGTQDSVATHSRGAVIARTVVSSAIAIAGALSGALVGPAGPMAGLAVGGAINAIPLKQRTTGTTSSTSRSIARGISTTLTSSTTASESVTSGTSRGITRTRQNKTIQETLKRIDVQLKRVATAEGLGMWQSAAYILAEDRATVRVAASAFRALLAGPESGVEASAVTVWDADHAARDVVVDEVSRLRHPAFRHPQGGADDTVVTPASLVNGTELALQMGMPRRSVPGLPVVTRARFAAEVTRSHGAEGTDARGLMIGHVHPRPTGERGHVKVFLDRDSLTMHTFVTGSTGTGKTTAIIALLDRLRRAGDTTFLVIEPSKGEYKRFLGSDPDVYVYGTNPRHTTLLRINPFRFPEGVHVLEHLDRVVELFNACWPMYAAMPAILKDAIERSYRQCGWDLTTSECPGGPAFPTFVDVLREVEEVIEESAYSGDTKGDYTGALVTRLRSLTTGLNRMIFGDGGPALADLFDRNVIVDISRVGSAETKALIMGVLVGALYEHRTTSGAPLNSPLRHVTVLEEAHALLRRVPLEQSSESANLVGRAVELIASSIAELRTFGEGFIIADQAPGLLDESAIRNTNTKVILRLPDRSDRELVGRAAALTDAQIEELARLERGVAAVYQNDWLEPVLVTLDRQEHRDSAFIEPDLTALAAADGVREAVDSLLAHQLPVDERAEQTERVGGPASEDFEGVAREVARLLDVRDAVDRAVMRAADHHELGARLDRVIRSAYGPASPPMREAICQALLKDFATRSSEPEAAAAIYRDWVTERTDAVIRDWVSRHPQEGEELP